MSNRIVYHGFKIRGYDMRSFIVEAGIRFLCLFQKRHRLRCPKCGGTNIESRGSKPRELRHLPIGNDPVVVRLDVARVRCKDCEMIRQVKIDFADPRKSYTRAFARYVVELLKYMTVKAVAQHLQVSWDLIKDIEKTYLKQHFSKPKLKYVKRIAIDEICIGKGHQYLTLVLDLDSGAVIYVAEGKNAAALDCFWQRLKHSRAQIEAIATDMSKAYISAARKCCPDATLVFDHFHIIKLYNEKLTQLRRQLYRQVQDDLQKQVLKGIRWLLLKAPENLDEERNEWERLRAALELNEPLAIAYYLKDDLEQVWWCDDKASAAKFLDDWILRAESSGIKVLKSFARTLAAYRSGILAYYDHRISTGPLEGTNNKIKTMKRQAYGFRDKEYLMLKIMAIHRTKSVLVG